MLYNQFFYAICHYRPCFISCRPDMPPPVSTIFLLLMVLVGYLLFFSAWPISSFPCTVSYWYSWHKSIALKTDSQQQFLFSYHLKILTVLFSFWGFAPRPDQGWTLESPWTWRLISLTSHLFITNFWSSASLPCAAIMWTDLKIWWQWLESCIASVTVSDCYLVYDVVHPQLLVCRSISEASFHESGCAL